MPLALATNEVVSQTIDTLEINAHTIDSELNELHISFDKGSLVNGVFMPVIKDLMLSVTGQDFVDAITEFETSNTGTKTGDLKKALYTQLIRATGLVGVIS